MINIKKEYQRYTRDLIRKGVSPSIVCISDVIRLVTEDEDKACYNFNTDNIVSGPFGELIKVNDEKGIVEIYNSIMDGFFSLKIYDLETGEMLPDGELGKEYSFYDSIDFFGYDEYQNLMDYVDNDFSQCHREIQLDKNKINISRLELSNKLAREKLKELKLKEKLLEVAKKSCKRYDYVNEALGDALGKIMANIDDAYNKHSEMKAFDSKILDEETIEIINYGLYLNRLTEESNAYSKISILPMTDVISSYIAYNTPKTKKIARKLIRISKKVSCILDPFIYSRIDVRNHLLNSSDIDRMSEKHKRLLLRRRDELDKSNTWGSYE